MTLKEVISRFDVLYPNVLEYAEKRELISRLEGKIFLELFSLYEGGAEKYPRCSEDMAPDTPLSVPFPFDDLYLKFLCAENDSINSDVDRYVNSARIFNAAYEEFASYLHRTRKRKTRSEISLPEVIR